MRQVFIGERRVCPIQDAFERKLFVIRKRRRASPCAR